MSDLRIDVSDLAHKFTKRGSVCAVCGKNFDALDYTDEDVDADENRVPLLLFRGEGDATEMLTLCWPCATVRMQKTPLN